MCETKRCKTCEEILPLSVFTTNGKRNNKHVYKPNCNKCMKLLEKWNPGVAELSDKYLIEKMKKLKNNPYKSIEEYRKHIISVRALRAANKVPNGFLRCKRCKIFFEKRYDNDRAEVCKPCSEKVNKEHYTKCGKAIQKEEVDNYVDSYMKLLLKSFLKNSELKYEDLPKEFINTYKNNLKLKRALRKAKKGEVQ